MDKGNVILIDLPVFPKGNITLSLPAVATVLSEAYEVLIIDLNLSSNAALIAAVASKKQLAFIGLKVSAQNYEIAKKLSAQLRAIDLNTSLVWGGELSTLLPDDCLAHADCVVQGMWEPIASEFIRDLETGSLKKIYVGHNQLELSALKPPRFDLIQERARYYSFMGLPLETSRGCTEVCTFFIVHLMHIKYFLF